MKNLIEWPALKEAIKVGIRYGSLLLLGLGIDYVQRGFELDPEVHEQISNAIKLLEAVTVLADRYVYKAKNIKLDGILPSLRKF